MQPTDVTQTAPDREKSEGGRRKAMSLSGLYVMGRKLTYYNPDFSAAAVILLIHLCISLSSFSLLLWFFKCGNILKRLF